MEIILTLLLRYPGAYVRYLFSGKRKSFKEYLKQDDYVNAGISWVIIIFIITIVVLLVR